MLFRSLRRHAIAGLLDGVVINDTPLKSPHFKLRALADLGAAEHVDDDPRTVQLLAQRGAARVFLLDWPRNRELDYEVRVERVRDLRDLAGRIDQ